MSDQAPIEEAVAVLNRLEKEKKQGVTVTSVKVSASEKVSTGEYENYNPHSTLEADVHLDGDWEEQKPELLETLLDLHQTNQKILETACENKIALPEEEDWMLQELLAEQEEQRDE